MQNLPTLELYKFGFTLEMQQSVQLPEYKGSAFRGAFAWTFRQIVCITKQQNCEGCIVRGQCSYFKFFETEISGIRPGFLSGVKKVPHPFIIHPPLETKRGYSAGESMTVGFTVFGSAISFLPYFIYTFQQMGQAGIGEGRKRFILKRVTSTGTGGCEKEIFSADNSGSLSSDFYPMTSEEIIKESEAASAARELRLKFLTPARLQQIGRVVTDKGQVTAKMLISLLERRLVCLSHFYCGGSIPEGHIFSVCDNIEIADNRLEYYQWKRYSNRQKKEIDMSGFMGELTLKGDIGYFAPLLSIGEHIHLGKNTVFGLGKYCLIKDH